MNKLKNNPAGRLLLIIKEGKKLNNLNLTYINAWQKIFNCNDLSETFKRISLVIDLVPKIIENVVKLKELNIINNEELYLQEIKKIPGFFLFDPKGHWKIFMSHFNNDIMIKLEICSDLLSNHLPEKVIKEDALNNLTKKVNDLIKEINDMNLDIELKNQILKLLLRVKYAIEVYPIAGTEILQETNFLNISELFLKLKNFKDSSWFKEIIDVTNIILTLINITDKIPAIQDTVNKFLGN